jgi:hypothetical protein
MPLSTGIITNARIGVRGSSVTGVNSKTGLPFGPTTTWTFLVESEQVDEGPTRLAVIKIGTAQ